MFYRLYYNIKMIKAGIIVKLKYKRQGIFLIERCLKNVDINMYQEVLNDIPDYLIKVFIKHRGFIEIKRKIPEGEELAGAAYERILEKENGKFPVWAISIKDKHPMTLYHEFGHILDCFLSKPSKSERFQSIYLNEKNLACSIMNYTPYNVSDSTEYFAESFKVFIINPKEMQKTLPKTYNYMLACI